MGGTSSTTAPPPNYTAQLLGAGIGAGAAVLSDKRAKENLKKVGKLNDGQSVYRFNYKGDPTTRIGLVAQEVERDHPEAVHQTDGWKSVDYDEATKDAVRRLLGGRVQGLATGGTPAEVVYRRADPPRPELVVLADVSGSVAQFATFTLYLLHSLSRHFGRVRSFAFIDGIDEVTETVRRHENPAEASRLIIANRQLIWFDGHSDYGHALESFRSQWGSAVSPRTTVLILGDGRSNYRDPSAWSLRDLARRASSVHWLNPEPRAAWGTGDSAIGDYRPHCTSVTECRTFNQVARFIEAIV